MTRHYYAIEYAYGPDVVNDGCRADLVRQFNNTRARDEWVADDPDCEALDSHHPRVRAAIAVARQGWGWPVAQTGW